MKRYEERIWTCKSTGSSQLTHKEAWEEEQEVTELLVLHPEFFHPTGAVKAYLHVVLVVLCMHFKTLSKNTDKQMLSNIRKEPYSVKVTGLAAVL